MNIANFRKSDAYYEDEYDRLTISLMKEKEEAWVGKLKLITDEDLFYKQQIIAELDIREYGAHFAQNKRSKIQEWIETDERKDRLIIKHLIPDLPYCTKCGKHMMLVDYDFISNDHQIHFIFSCGQGTKHNAILTADGKQLAAPANYCPYCNGTIQTNVKRTKTSIIATDSCKVCTWSATMEYDTKPRQQKQLLPISEEERKIYCTDFKNRRGFIHDLKKLAALIDQIGIKHDLSQIKMLKISDLEKTLTENLTKAKFSNLQFEAPKISSFMTVRFSIRDTTERTGSQSIKTLKKAIANLLFSTNWRLTTTEIEYRMGYLTGQLKGADQKADLEKIAAEIDQTR